MSDTSIINRIYIPHSNLTSPLTVSYGALPAPPAPAPGTPLPPPQNEAAPGASSSPELISRPPTPPGIMWPPMIRGSAVFNVPEEGEADGCPTGNIGALLVIRSVPPIAILLKLPAAPEAVIPAPTVTVTVVPG